MMNIDFHDLPEIPYIHLSSLNDSLTLVSQMCFFLFCPDISGRSSHRLLGQHSDVMLRSHLGESFGCDVLTFWRAYMKELWSNHPDWLFDIEYRNYMHTLYIFLCHPSKEYKNTQRIPGKYETTRIQWKVTFGFCFHCSYEVVNSDCISWDAKWNPSRNAWRIIPFSQWLDHGC